MAPQIDSDSANIPSVNLLNGSTDPTTPGSGHAQLYVKNGLLYVRLASGTVVPVGGAVELAEGQLAVGDGDGLLSALALGSEGDLLTADASGMASWAAPAAPGSGGDYVKIAQWTAADALQTTLSFTDTMTGYEALRILGYARANGDNNGTNLFLKLNNDTGSNYRFASFSAANAGWNDTDLQTQNYCNIGYIRGAYSEYGSSSFDIMIHNPNKTVGFVYVEAISLYIDTYNYSRNVTLLRYLGASAISQIDLSRGDVGQYFDQGSRFTLYGIKS